jgi:hypothetical protein
VVPETPGGGTGPFSAFESYANVLCPDEAEFCSLEIGS